MKILILGAGIYQVPLIKKAKEMGHFVMVASIRGNYPGFTFADKCVYLDTTDREAICKSTITGDEDILCQLIARQSI